MNPFFFRGGYNPYLYHANGAPKFNPYMNPYFNPYEHYYSVYPSPQITPLNPACSPISGSTPLTAIKVEENSRESFDMEPVC